MNMKVTVSSRTNSLDDARREDIRGRMFFALSRFCPHIERVTVEIRDVDRTRGGSQQLCRLSVQMKRLGSFSVESVEEEAPDAVSRAVDRAAKRVQRILERRRDETY
jgi:hypothetical protein